MKINKTMKIESFANLIREIPTDYHAVRASWKTWEKHAKNPGTAGEALKTIFPRINDTDEHSDIIISRKEIRTYGEHKKIKECLMATLVWGYPRGMRGKNTEYICESLDDIEKLIQPIYNNPIEINGWRTHFDTVVAQTTGMGLSTYSKFLAFLPNIKIGGYTPLILDNVIATVLGNGVFEEFGELDGLNYNNAHARYPTYLQHMHQIADDIKATPEQLEMFIFIFGRNLKAN